MTLRLPRSTLFPYTTLFRSAICSRSTSMPSTFHRSFRPTIRVTDSTTSETCCRSLLCCWRDTCRRRRRSLGWPWGYRRRGRDRKSTRLNSSHLGISYAVFCLNDTPTTEIYTLSLHDALPICDLLALDVDAIDLPSLLPADDSGYGFDNIGDVLSISPLLLERYMSAAEKVARLALGIPSARPRSEEHTSELQSLRHLVCRLLLE